MQNRTFAPDLRTQLESLLDTVWRAERQERVLDRCEQVARIEAERARAQARKEAR